MTPRRFVIATFILSLLSGAAIEGAQPVARVLEVKGKVTAQRDNAKPRDLAPLDTVYLDQKMALASEASITLAFRADGHLERLAKPGEVTVGRLGCEPKTVVEVLASPERHKRLISTTIQTLRPTGETGATIVRGGLTGEPSREISPLPNSTILGTPMKFTWPAVPGASQYRVVIENSEAKTKATLTTTQARLECGDTAVLKPGGSYDWEVDAAAAGGSFSRAYSGCFTVATEEQKTRASELQVLAADANPVYLTLAATWYEENNLVAQALEAYERLAAAQPNTAAYQFALSRLYRQANRQAESQKAYQKARRLQPPPDKSSIRDWLRKGKD